MDKYIICLLYVICLAEDSDLLHSNSIRHTKDLMEHLQSIGEELFGRIPIRRQWTAADTARYKCDGGSLASSLHCSRHSFTQVKPHAWNT